MLTLSCMQSFDVRRIRFNLLTQGYVNQITHSKWHNNLIHDIAPLVLLHLLLPPFCFVFSFFCSYFFFSFFFFPPFFRNSKLLGGFLTFDWNKRLHMWIRQCREGEGQSRRRMVAVFDKAPRNGVTLCCLQWGGWVTTWNKTSTNGRLLTTWWLRAPTCFGWRWGRTWTFSGWIEFFVWENKMLVRCEEEGRRRT